MGPQSLRTRTFNSFSWLALARVVTQGFTFITTLILARLLSPSDFGLMGIALVVINFLTMLNNFGLETAIIQRKELDDTTLSTVFWPNLGLGFLVFGIAVLISGQTANLLGVPGAKSVITLLSLSLIFDSFGIVQGGILKRELRFRNVAIREVIITLGYGISAVVGALLGLGVWALVIGHMMRSLLGALAFWFFVSWRPSFTFDYKAFLEVYGFGFKMLLNSIVEFFRGNTANALIGKFLGTYDLGIYTLAYNVATLVHGKITALVRNTLTPAYSKIQDDFKKLYEASSKAAQYLAVVTFPASIGLIVVAPEFVRVVYGAKWGAAILPIQILLIAGTLLTVNPVLEIILIVIGRVNTLTVWNIIRTSFLMLAIFLGLKLGGLVGVAIGITLTVVIYTPISHVLVFKYIKGSVWSLWKNLAVLMLLSVFMGVGVFFFRKVLSVFVSSEFFLLLTEVLFGIALYLTTLVIFKPPAWDGVLGLVLPVFKKGLSKISNPKPRIPNSRIESNEQ